MNRKQIFFVTLAAAAGLSAAAAGSVFAQQPITPQAAVVTRAAFGRTAEGTPVDIYTLTNRNGLVAKVMTYGATLTELHVPDRNGRLGDVVLGFSNLQPYLDGHPYFGSTVGRVANRIAGGRFMVDGQEFRVAVNNGPNHLHGGIRAFDKVVWRARPLASLDGAAVAFTYTSPNGHEGYPGALRTTVTYTLTDRNELKLDYRANTDRATPVNLTHHSYFNLAGQGDVLGHELRVAAARYTPGDDTLIPTGEIAPVRGTPFDFTRPTPIGARIGQLRNDVPSGGGYDLNYVLDSGGRRLALAAEVREPQSGRMMEIYTTEPGIQFYTGNHLDGTLTGKGINYGKYSGFCLETQNFPDAVNKPNFPNSILRPGQTYRQTTIHRFSAR
jgi:aldose 1-epimerase